MRNRRLITKGLPNLLGRLARVGRRAPRRRLAFAVALALCMLAASKRADCGSTVASEDPSDVSAAIRQAAATTAPANAEITLGPAMGARYMPVCRRPLAVTVTGSEPYEQATAHCAAPSWTLYVTVTVDARMPVVVMAKPLAAGDTLRSDDLTLRQEPVSLYAGRQVYYHIDDAVGATAILSLSVGTILTQSNMEQPLMVQAGQSITVDAESGGVDIAITGTAQQSGRLGDTIMIANPSSGKRFPATVTRSGARVQLGP
ncbi:MAG: flagellar basal body P-ring formation protein FlgA [Proteobacteria bacterium]|nr:flagellar basal body P-ring formation protein FlgA [Pseudomonadota bacterium]